MEAKLIKEFISPTTVQLAMETCPFPDRMFVFEMLNGSSVGLCYSDPTNHKNYFWDGCEGEWFEQDLVELL